MIRGPRGLLVIRATNLRGAKDAAFRVSLLGPQVILLDLPEPAEGPVNEFLRHGDPEILLHHPSELVRISIRAHLRFLEELHNLGYRGEVRCVADEGEALQELELGSEASRLTLRYLLTGRVDVEMWRGLLRNALRGESWKPAVNLLYALEEVGESWAAVLDIRRLRAVRPISTSGLVDLVLCGLPFCRSPLEEMLRLERIGRLTDERLRALVAEQAEFVRVVQTSPDLETAYERWTNRCLGAWACG
ncbi:MAG: hypothetical protein QW490_02625 [Nitrososphaerota archaeon]